MDTTGWRTKSTSKSCEGTPIRKQGRSPWYRTAERVQPPHKELDKEVKEVAATSLCNVRQEPPGGDATRVKALESNNIKTDDFVHEEDTESDTPDDQEVMETQVSHENFQESGECNNMKVFLGVAEKCTELTNGRSQMCRGCMRGLW